MKLLINDKRKSEQFSHIFKCLKDVVEFVTLDFKKEGLYFQSMDSSQICLCELVLSYNWFDEYNIKKNETVTIPTGGIYHALHCLNDNQSIIIEYDEKKDNLSIEFTGEKTINKSFDLVTFETDNNLMEIPETEFSVDIEMASCELNTLIQELIVFNKDIQFHCDTEWVKLMAKGEMGKMSVELKDDNIISYAIEEGLSIVKEYAIEFFKKACAFHKISDIINLHIEDNSPIKICYYLDDTKDNTFIFYIAPKVMDDEF